MRIQIEEERCVGGGQCVMAADDVFDQRDEDGVVFLVRDSDEIEQGMFDRVRRAADLCPGQAIRLVE